MTDAQTIFDGLSAPFPADYIDWRVGSTNKDKTKGMALAYIDARTAMDRLDSICGPGCWQCTYTPAGTIMICNIGVFVEGQWVWKADGAGATDFEGEKGAMSDAFKRAAVRWGIGRYLYDLKAPWVAIEPFGKSYKINDEERKKLDESHEEAVKKLNWGTPTDVATYRFLLNIVQNTITQPADVIAFREKYASMFPMLRVAMRRHLNNELDRIGGPQREAA